MAEVTSSLTYAQVAAEVVRREGCGTTDAALAVDFGELWIANANAWSFDNVSTTMTVGVGTTAYLLPYDFGGNLKRLCYQENDSYVFLARIDSETMLDMMSRRNVTGQPQYFNVESTGFTAGTVGPSIQWQVRIYPEPATSYTYTYWYHRIWPSLASSTASYLPGGNQFSLLHLYSALAQHEETKGDVSGVYHQLRDKELANCMQRDMQRNRTGILGTLQSAERATLMQGWSRDPVIQTGVVTEV